MAALDRVMELQSQGISQNEIVTQLQNEGIPTKEISEAINQASVKNAISPQEAPQMPPSPEMAQVQEQLAPETTPQYSEQPQGSFPQEPTTQEPVANPEVYPQEGQVQGQDYYQQTPQAYSGQEYYPPAATPDTETISEIVDQIVSEKLSEFQKKTGDISAFQSTIQDKVADIDERLRRIEASIDKLQQAIIGKIGEFGESSAMIHKDLDNLHGTMSKLMDPLIDNAKALKKKKS